MAESPIYEYAQYLMKNSQKDDLKELFDMFLFQSKNIELWILYIECVSDNFFAINQADQNLDSLTSAYETALQCLTHHPDIPIIFEKYLQHLESNYNQSLIIDKIRYGYHLILKQAIFNQDKYISDYEHFENQLNRTSAKAILEKLNISKLSKKLSLKFDINKPIATQISTINYKVLQKALTGEDETKTLNLILKDRFYWDEELWYKIISSSKDKMNLIIESIFVNTINNYPIGEIPVKNHRITNSNLFFILMGAFFREISIEEYIFRQTSFEKLKTICNSTTPQKITLLDLNTSFLQLKRRQKDLLFLHLFSFKSKRVKNEFLQNFFISLIDLVGPLVFYYFGRILYHNTGKIDQFINVMLLGIKMNTNIKNTTSDENSEPISLFASALQQYLIKFLYSQGKIERAKQFESLFGLEEKDSAFKLNQFESLNFDDEKSNMQSSMSDFYYNKNINYNYFEIEFKENAHFSSMMKFDVLTPLRHENILSLMEENENLGWIEDCEFNISLFELKNVFQNLKNQ